MCRLFCENTPNANSEETRLNSTRTTISACAVHSFERWWLTFLSGCLRDIKSCVMKSLEPFFLLCYFLSSSWPSKVKPVPLHNWPHSVWREKRGCIIRCEGQFTSLSWEILSNQGEKIEMGCALIGEVTVGTKCGQEWWSFSFSDKSMRYGVKWKRIVKIVSKYQVSAL